MSIIHCLFPCLRPIRLVLLWAILLPASIATAQNGPACNSFSNRTMANGLGKTVTNAVHVTGTTIWAATNGGLSRSTNDGQAFSNATKGLGNAVTNGVFAIGSTVYAATTGGLGISTDGGVSFTNKTTANGLGDNGLWGVYAVGSTVYVATQNGLSISTDGGQSFTNYGNGLADQLVNGVFAVGNTVYAATAGGLGISTNGGQNFNNKTTLNGLGDNAVYGVYAVGNTIYAATANGLSISTDGGISFTNTVGGLGSRIVLGVHAVGSTVYAATYGGLSISTNGGRSFTNRTTANGLGDDIVYGVYAGTGAIYATTYGGLTFCGTVNGITPVTLTYFNGRMTDAGALLGWATAREENNTAFQIERGRDRNRTGGPAGPGISFESIGTVPSLAPGGNSVTTLTYTFTDTQPLPGVNYYRLIQTDHDGTRTPSRIVSLSREAAAPVLFPNPVSAAGEASVEPPIAYDRYELIDSQGKTIQQATQPGVLSRVSLTGLPAGVYLLRVQTQGGAKTWRVVR